MIKAMHTKKKIRNRIYGLYLNSVSVDLIESIFNGLFSQEEIHEIIDYMNEIYL